MLFYACCTKCSFPFGNDDLACQEFHHLIRHRVLVPIPLAIGLDRLGDLAFRVVGRHNKGLYLFLGKGHALLFKDALHEHVKLGALRGRFLQLFLELRLGHVVIRIDILPHIRAGIGIVQPVIVVVFRLVPRTVVVLDLSKVLCRNFGNLAVLGEVCLREVAKIFVIGRLLYILIVLLDRGRVVGEVRLHIVLRQFRRFIDAVQRDVKFRLFPLQSGVLLILFREGDGDRELVARLVADQLVKLIKEADHVVIMGHRMSDLDAIGAAEGVLRICKICDVPAVIAVRRDATLAGSLIDALCRAGQADDFIDPKGALPIISKKTLCVVVDTYQLGLVESKEILERCGKVAVIDHHRRGVGFIEHADLVCHEPYSSSASELVTELLQYVGDRDDKPSRVEAEGLLSGIMLDTRDFTLHTGVRTFEAAAALRRYGAETERVRQLFDVTMVEYNAKADLVEAAQMYRSCAISVSGEVPPEARVAIAQAANDLLTIQNVEASFVAVQVGSGVNISARSLGAVNVQVIMESLGGGGHQTMAAAQLKHITPEAARARIQTAIDQYRESQKKPLSKNEPESRKKEKQG